MSRLKCLCRSFLVKILPQSEFQMLEEAKGKTELQIVREFMDTEWQRQKLMEEL